MTPELATVYTVPMPWLPREALRTSLAWQALESMLVQAQ
jgi:hypothetical protein